MKSTHPHCVTLNKKLVENVKKHPEFEGMSFSGLIGRLLKKWLEEKRNE